MKSSKDLTTAVILAGGKGRRMGGKDKGLVHFSGRRLIDYTIDAIKPQVNSLIINANRNLSEYQLYGYPVVCDNFPNFAGPLAGIEAALSICQTPYLVTVPCDTPKLPSGLVAKLAVAMVSNDNDLAVADDGQRMQPVFCLMKIALLQSLREQLKLSLIHI